MAKRRQKFRKDQFITDNPAFEYVPIRVVRNGNRFKGGVFRWVMCYAKHQQIINHNSHHTWLATEFGIYE